MIFAVNRQLRANYLSFNSNLSHPFNDLLNYKVILTPIGYCTADQLLPTSHSFKLNRRKSINNDV